MVSFRLDASSKTARGPFATALVRLGATLVFGLFLGMGIFFLVMLVRDGAERLAPHGWSERSATILRSEVVRREGEKPYVPIVSFQYEWNGETRTGGSLSPDDEAASSYDAAAGRLAPYPVGARVPCRVSPDGRAVLEPGSPALLLFVLLPLTFVVIGGGGIFLTWRPRRRDAFGRPALEPISTRAGKSRGARAMVGFGAVFALIGAAIAWPTAIGPTWSVWRARDWTPGTCVVEHSSVVSHASDDGTTYSVDILYRWERGGRTYRSSRYSFYGGSSSGRDGKQDVVRAHPAGRPVPCWLDPDRPDRAVIERGLTGHALIGLVPLAFVAFGLVFVRLGRRKLARRDRLEQMLATTGRGPAPDDPVLEWLPDFSISPGPARLAPESTRAGRLAGVVFACAFWNGIVAIFVRQALDSFDRGRPEWGLTLFLVPFALVGIGLCFAIVYTLLSLTNARPLLEVNASAPTLGATFEVGWRMRGRLAGLQRLRLVLEGREEATYRRGTDSYTVRETFASLTLADLNDPYALASGHASVVIPRDAMHSFDGGNNSITWSLHLHGDVHRWPDVDERYPIVVLPLAREDVGKPEADA